MMFLKVRPSLVFLQYIYAKSNLLVINLNKRPVIHLNFIFVPLILYFY